MNAHTPLDREDMIDAAILDILLHCERLAENEHRNDIALVLRDAHLNCCRLVAERRRPKR